MKFHELIAKIRADMMTRIEARRLEKIKNAPPIKFAEMFVCPVCGGAVSVEKDKHTELGGRYFHRLCAEHSIRGQQKRGVL